MTAGLPGFGSRIRSSEFRRQGNRPLGKGSWCRIGKGWEFDRVFGD